MGRAEKRRVTAELKKKRSKSTRKIYQERAAVARRRGEYADMLEHWRNVVTKITPMWMQIASVYIPPAWYRKAIEDLMVMCVCVNMPYFARLLRVVLLLPLMWVKKRVRYFGSKTKLTQPAKGFWVQEIYSWWKLIDKTEWDLR